LPPDDAPSPIRSLGAENPRRIGKFPERVPGDGEVPPEPSPSVSIAISVVSIDLIAISINFAVSYDEEGVVLPRG
jgi:hypothetical protein